MPPSAVALPAPTRLRRIARSLWRPSTLLALALIGGVVALDQWVRAIGGPEVLIERFGVGAPLLCVPVQTLLAAAPVPSELFTVAASSAYGWLAGAAIGVLGWTGGSMIQYGLARKSTSSAAAEAGLARLPAWLRRFPVGHPAFLIIGRWIPMGYHVVNVMSGIRRVPARWHLWCAIVGSVPGAVVWAGVGAGVQLL